VSEIKSFKDLRVWQLGIEIVKQVYLTTKALPTIEMYGLTSQMRIAAVSIPSNTAEGHNRSHLGEYNQFLNISIGSCAELETQLIISQEPGYIKEENCTKLRELIESEVKQLRSLASKLKGKRNY